MLWATYGSFYFCRVNLGAGRNTIQQSLGLTVVEMGFVLGAGKLGYALGQLVNGQLTERLGARRILSAGMLGSGAMTLLLAFSPELAALPGLRVVPGILVAPVASIARGLDVAMASSPLLSLMLLLAFANGWMQAGGWPPCVKIAGQWFPVEERGKTMGVLGTSLTLGSAAATLTVGALVSATAGWWRVAFLVPALVLFASFAHMRMRLREKPGGAGSDRVHAGGLLEDASPRLTVGEALRLTVTNPRIWILALGLFGLDAARYGVLDWAPGHLAEVHRTGALSAALKTAVFPIAGAAGALASGPLTDRYFGSRRAPVCALMLCAVGLLTLVYRFVVGIAVAPTVICLGAHRLLSVRSANLARGDGGAGLCAARRNGCSRRLRRLPRLHGCLQRRRRDRLDAQAPRLERGHRLVGFRCDCCRDSRGDAVGRSARACWRRATGVTRCTRAARRGACPECSAQ